MTNTVKLNGVRPDVIKLQLFPFSLRGVVVSWFESVPYGLVTTWEELVEAFLSKVFLFSLTLERRGEIISLNRRKMRVFTMPGRDTRNY